MRALLALAFSLCTALAQSQPSNWQPLFDGKTLEGWKVTPFTGKGPVRVEQGVILLGPGAPLAGITRTTPVLPQDQYELRFEAARLKGNDFFASVTAPIGGAHFTWVIGGWGGDIVGISSIDGWDASENETRTYFTFENAKYYTLRLRVAAGRITGWIDDQKAVDVDVNGREITLRRGEINLNVPLGFAAYNTAGGIRKIEYRRLALKP